MSYTLYHDVQVVISSIFFRNVFTFKLLRKNELNKQKIPKCIYKVQSKRLFLQDDRQKKKYKYGNNHK